MDRLDPFYVVRDEVIKSLTQAQVEYEAWKHEVVAKSVNIKPAEMALRETIKNIDWDLEDLQETVLIVEKNPTKFYISGEELRSRQRFLQEVKSVVKDVKDQLYDPSGLISGNHKRINFDVPNTVKVSPTRVSGMNGKSSLALPGSAKPASDSGFTQDLKRRSEHPGMDAPGLLADQQAMLKEQDEHLDQLGSSISRLKQMSHRIGGELGDQVALLDEFGEEMASTESRMDSALRRASRLLHIDSSRSQWYAIGGLLLILFIILLLFAVL
ncbi:unnamed protein product [Mesocestoides corti]|nr:unnamed protein product [Mesocestoides corti]